MGKHFVHMGNPVRVVLFFDSKPVIITKEMSDNNDRILVWQIKIDDEIYLFANLYNSNTVVVVNRAIWGTTIQPHTKSKPSFL